MNIRFCEDDSSFAGVLDSEFRLSVLSGNTTNRTRQVIAVQGLHILDLEGVQVQVIQTKQCSGVLCELESVKEERGDLSAAAIEGRHSFRETTENNAVEHSPDLTYVQIESQSKGLDEISSLLQCSSVVSVL